jgi:hypothetical protein
VAENAEEDGNYDWKDNEQPDVVEHSDQLLMGHGSRSRIKPLLEMRLEALEHLCTPRNGIAVASIILSRTHLRTTSSFWKLGRGRLPGRGRTFDSLNPRAGLGRERGNFDIPGQDCTQGGRLKSGKTLASILYFKGFL